MRQAEQLVFTAGVAIPDLEQRIEQQENFISILLGQNPQSIARGRRLVEQPHALEVPAGLPSSLLERRPEIRQAAQQLIMANAQIGVAKAAYFPQISLTAVGGCQSSALTGLFFGPAGLWSVGANLIGHSGVSGASKVRRHGCGQVLMQISDMRRLTPSIFRDQAQAALAYLIMRTGKFGHA